MKKFLKFPSNINEVLVDPHSVDMILTGDYGEAILCTPSGQYSVDMPPQEAGKLIEAAVEAFEVIGE